MSLRRIPEVSTQASHLNEKKKKSLVGMESTDASNPCPMSVLIDVGLSLPLQSGDNFLPHDRIEDQGHTITRQ